MASIKAIAAIAMTLIVAVPILMGYGLASEETTATNWEAESTTNVTDLLFNSTADYYTDYMSPMNNATLLQQITAQGSTEWHQESPGYQSVGSTYTSIKEYSSTSTETVSLTPATTERFTQDAGPDAHSIGYYTGMETTMSVSDYIYFTIESENLNPLHWTVYLGNSQYYIGNLGNIGTAYFLLLRDSASSWILYIKEGSGSWSEYGSISTWEFYTDADYVIESTLCAYTAITAGTPYTFNLYNAHSVKITTSGGDYYVAGRSTIEVSLSASGLASVGGTTYTGVTAISVTKGVGGNLSVEVGGWTGNYADPAEGWAIPVPDSYQAYYTWWYNGQQNHEVQMMIHFSGGNYAVLGPATSTNVSQLVEIYFDGTNIYVDGLTDSEPQMTLGEYTDVLAVITDTETTVYGLKEWPTMGTEAKVQNYVVADYADLGSSFAYVYMADDLNGYSSEVTYRVDSANIVAGSYPIMDDAYFRGSATYPGQSYQLKINSVSFSGDYFIAGHNTFTVSDGYATGTDIDGETFTVKLRGMVIQEIYDSDAGTYTCSINGHEITTIGNSSYYFDGEWSITASLSTLTKTTSTQQTWAPGEFAFDKEDFAACGLLVAGACLIGLGMTGSRSGAKMGVLLMICGGAGLIYFTLI